MMFRPDASLIYFMQITNNGDYLQSLLSAHRQDPFGSERQQDST
jgi:hypothetical protein